MLLEDLMHATGEWPFWGVTVVVVLGLSGAVLLPIVRRSPAKPAPADPERRSAAHLAGPDWCPKTSPSRAVICWQRGDGKYKHCGLRPDPYSGSPPSLSVTNLDLPVPALEEGEAEKLRLLAERLADLTAKKEARTDAMTLHRFLRARKGNVLKAEGYLRKAAAYRNELGLNRLDVDWNLQAWEHCFAPWWARGGIVGHGFQGQCVGFERTCKGRFPELLKLLPFDTLRKLDAVHLCRILAGMEEDSMRTGRPFNKSILVMDLDGLGWDYCDRAVLKAYGKLVECRDMLVPSTLAHILLIRAPASFAIAWQIGQKFLHPDTREKVQIVSKENSLATLRKYMPDEVIPVFVGGKFAPKGDPDCRLVFGDDGPIPPQALERLQALISGGGSGLPGDPVLDLPGHGDPREDAACCACPRRAKSV